MAGAAAAGRPYAPSTCSQTPRSVQMPASSPIGSTAPVSVVPAVATTATGVMPAATSASMAAAASAAIIRRRSSIGIDRTLAAPMPSTSAARCTL